MTKAVKLEFREWLAALAESYSRDKAERKKLARKAKTEFGISPPNTSPLNGLDEV